MLMLIVVIGYLLFAVAMEVAVVGQFYSGAGFWASFLDWRLLASGGIIWGLWRGEIAGMMMGFACAMAYGLSQSSGQLGAAIVGFTFGAFLAGASARIFILRFFRNRAMLIFIILLISEATRMGVRWALGLSAWGDLHIIGLVITTLLATGIHDAFAKQFRQPLYARD